MEQKLIGLLRLFSKRQLSKLLHVSMSASDMTFTLLYISSPSHTHWHLGSIQLSLIKGCHTNTASPWPAQGPRWINIGANHCQRFSACIQWLQFLFAFEGTFCLKLHSYALKFATKVYHIDIELVLWLVCMLLLLYPRVPIFFLSMVVVTWGSVSKLVFL